MSFRSIAVFKFREPLPMSEEEDDGEQLTLQMSRPVAMELLNAIREQGIPTNCIEPYAGEGGWEFVATIGTQQFSVFTDWTGINDDDFIACCPGLEQGWFKTLFCKPIRDERIEPIRKAVETALTQMRVERLHWLTDEEFERAYCDGQPLPDTAG